LAFKPHDLVGDGNVTARLHGAQFLDLLFELADRFFEIQIGAHHIST